MNLSHVESQLEHIQTTITTILGTNFGNPQKLFFHPLDRFVSTSSKYFNIFCFWTLFLQFKCKLLKMSAWRLNSAVWFPSYGWVWKKVNNLTWMWRNVFAGSHGSHTENPWRCSKYHVLSFGIFNVKCCKMGICGSY